MLFEQKHPPFTPLLQGEVCDGAAAAVRPGDQAGVRAGGAGGVQVSSEHRGVAAHATHEPSRNHSGAATFIRPQQRCS